jgi:hypothetical protein
MRIARRGRNAEVFRAAAARPGDRVTGEEIVPLVTLDARMAVARGVMATVEVVRGVPRS